MATPVKYTKCKVVKLTEVQHNTLKKLETYYVAKNKKYRRRNVK